MYNFLQDSIAWVVLEKKYAFQVLHESIVENKPNAGLML